MTERGGNVALNQDPEGQGGIHGHLKAVAREAIDAFAQIANSARQMFGSDGPDFGSFATVNESTAEALAARLREHNDTRQQDCLKLSAEPAIARLVIADEDDTEQVLYISASGRIGAPGITLCSYMSPKGRLASLDPGNGDYISLPGRAEWFDVIEKTTFRTVEDSVGWDSRPAVYFAAHNAPKTVKSLRELLSAEGISAREIDALEEWLAEEEIGEGDLVFEGVKKEALTAMQLRVAPILDRFQDEIFRLPIDQHIAVLGPPGTGKTTTLIRRLRQKLDFAYLSEDEKRDIPERDQAGLLHQDSWIMFTPTELLRQYVKEAFGKEGVPVHDGMLKTWEYWSLEAGKRDLSILATGTGSGLILRRDAPTLREGTLTAQTEWYEDFEAYHQTAFIDAMAKEVALLVDASDGNAQRVGRRAKSSIDREGLTAPGLAGDLLRLASDLRQVGKDVAENVPNELSQPLADFAADDEGFLSAFEGFVDELEAEKLDDEDEEDFDEDDREDVARKLTGRKLAIDVFRKAMRTLAIGQAQGRRPGRTSRAGKLLDFVEKRGHTLPDLRAAGQRLLVQRAARRLARGPETLVQGIPARYRQYRRNMRDQGRWYSDNRTNALHVNPAELDILVLAMLVSARMLEAHPLVRTLDQDAKPVILDGIGRLRRNQVLVDEATDFSPVQLAIMRHLVASEPNGFFVSGDFNQRLTYAGSRSEAELKWAAPNITIHRVHVTYRQSRKLAEFATELARMQGAEVDEVPPDHLDNTGFAPAIGTGLHSDVTKADWLSDRIAEIHLLATGTAPTIAVLAPDEEALEPLATSLTAKLERFNIRAVACPKGQVKGMEGDVRLFAVEHIKGLEFEAVFFVDIDRLADKEPELFDRYLYVGATRAATFLAVTLSSPELPEALTPMRRLMQDDWSKETI